MTQTGVTTMSQRLYPRPIVREKSEAEIAEEHQQSIRDCIENRLYDLFASQPVEAALPDDKAPNPKSTYFDRESAVREPYFHGRMTKRPEFSQDTTGCDLAHMYVLYLDTNGRVEEIEDDVERRQRKLRAALWALRGIQPDLADLIEEHTGRHRAPVRLERIIDRRPRSNRTVYDAHDEALDLIAGLVKPEQD